MSFKSAGLTEGKVIDQISVFESDGAVAYRLALSVAAWLQAAVKIGCRDMTKIDEIKGAIRTLPTVEKIELKRWLDDVDAQLFDDKIEADAAAGRLDRLIANARTNFKAGRQTPL
jgi:hypothetical protein